MAYLLIIENESRDAQIATESALQSGYSSVDCTPSANAAHTLLEKRRAEKEELPTAILLDLDLGTESGFDFLRIRHETPWILEIPLVVWTKLTDHNEALCDVFKIQGYVRKYTGGEGLRKALESLGPR